jgi:acyl-[acyl carrier protein]--UDP-N-acetylglucosamine O-acyltransferase
MTTVIKFFGYAKIGSTRPDQKHKNTKKKVRVGGKN